MGSGGGGNTSQTNSGPPPWVGKYGRQWLPDVWSYLTTGQGTTSLMNDPFPNMQVAGFSPDQMAGMNMIDANTGSAGAVTGAANQDALATLGGQYLNPATNPYLNDTYNTAAQQMTDQFKYGTAPSTMSQFAAGGGYGSSAYNDAQAANDYGYGNNLASLGAQIYGGNYQNERNNMINTMNNAGTIATNSYIPANELISSGSMQQGQEQNVYNTDYQNAYNQANFPFQALDMMGSAISQMGGLGGRSFSTMPSLGGKGL